MTPGQVEVACACRCELGESPLWNPLDHRVYWVDIPQGVLHRLEPKTRQNERFHLPGPVGGFTLQADGSLLLFMENGAIRIWRHGHVEEVIAELPELRGSRFNDVIADPAGRVFCGTMSTRDGNAILYRLDEDASIHLIRADLGLANGMGFAQDGTGLYLTDTGARQILLFPYDAQTGELGTPRTFVNVSESEGYPDGLTVDVEGFVWSARWDGHAVVRYSPEGRETARITVPVANVTSLAFGGEDYRDVYITTAGGNEPSAGPQAGNLFRCPSKVAGKREFYSRVALG